MADRIVLHIGPRKTATTYVQRALQALVTSGDLSPGMYPVRTRGRLDHNHVPGLIDLARTSAEIGLQNDAWTHQDGSDADALLRAVASTPGDVILSAEAMSVLRPSGASAIAAAFAPTPMDVIITARALDRVLPSSWQQHVRNANIETYIDYLALRTEERASHIYESALNRGFWRAYRYADLVQRWQGVARTVSVVTIPTANADPGETWRRFVSAAAIEELPTNAPWIPDDVANVSLTGSETFVLHDLNVAARAAGEGRREVRARHRRLLRTSWTKREHRGRRLGLTHEVQDDVRAWSADDVADLGRCGVAIHGHLSDLSCAAPGNDPGLPTTEEVSSAARAAREAQGEAAAADGIRGEDD